MKQSLSLDRSGLVRILRDAAIAHGRQYQRLAQESDRLAQAECSTLAAAIESAAFIDFDGVNITLTP